MLLAAGRRASRAGARPRGAAVLSSRTPLVGGLLTQSGVLALARIDNANSSGPPSRRAAVTAVPAPPAPSGAYYRRPLADDLVPFSSPRGRKLFNEAMDARCMESYWALAEHFQCQAHPAFCGLTTLTMVLNSLQIDPGRPWKGPWRWFTEEQLDCCKPLPDIVRYGISLREFATLARCQDASVELHYASACTLDEFREAISRVCRPTPIDGIPPDRLVVSFDRRKINQTGSGHFSPVAGYHPGEDRILVLDTARFKYPPFWVRVDMMWEAMRAQVEPEWPISRGWMLIGKRKLPPSHCPTTISSFAAVAPRLKLCWTKAIKHMLVSSSQLGQPHKGEAHEPPRPKLGCCTDVLLTQLEVLFLSAGPDSEHTLALTLSTEAHRQGIDTVLVSEQLRPLLHTETRRCVAAVLRSAGFADVVDLATLMVLAAAEYPPFRERIGEHAARELTQMHKRDMALESSPLLDEVLAYQVGKLADQMELLGKVPRSCLVL
ncbi:Phytochelatin synthase-domain-containing protein [Pavlovales sp. CCMP2436]|nr:Phytochelatin synthase-domain-containing protein [Pavlovales sp. CCMP2436]